jgi:hypothetical protein
MMIQLKTGDQAFDVVRFDTPPTALGFLTDMGAEGGGSTAVRVALHGNGQGASWKVETVTLTPAEPSLVLNLENTNYDGASFVRQDNGPAVAVNWT